jgi:hypothetical protein
VNRNDLVGAVRFVLGLPGFLRHPVTVDRARTILRHRLEQREARFLTLFGSVVYDRPASPYRSLLRAAGCEYADVARLVRSDGVEGALRALCRGGVYLTRDEFLGRQPARRGAATVAVDPDRLRMPGGGASVTRLGGLTLAGVAELAVNQGLVIEARAGMGWRHAVWSVPGAAATAQVLRFAAFGAPPARWFSQIDPAAPGLAPRYRWSQRVLRWGSGLARVPLPSPECVPLEAPGPVLRWIADVQKAGATPHLLTFASSAVGLSEAAGVAAVDLRGAQLTVTGEPFTEARRRAVSRTGAVAVPHYGATETGGLIAHGCLAPRGPDDLHLFHDLRAVIHPEERAAAVLPEGTLLLTSLARHGPFVLLNVAIGDAARVDVAACGCRLAELGWTTLLSGLHSPEKLTAGGVCFADSAVVPILEEVLPGRFGGGPTDYQLVEEESAAGQPIVRLLVHPRLGPLDGPAIADAFLTALGDGPGAARLMARAWRQAGLLRLEREAPRPTAHGKIQHMGPARRGAGAGSLR